MRRPTRDDIFKPAADQPNEIRAAVNVLGAPNPSDKLTREAANKIINEAYHRVPGVRLPEIARSAAVLAEEIYGSQYNTSDTSASDAARRTISRIQVVFFEGRKPWPRRSSHSQPHTQSPGAGYPHTHGGAARQRASGTLAGGQARCGYVDRLLASIWGCLSPRDSRGRISARNKRKKEKSI